MVGLNTSIENRRSARETLFEPVTGITATNVQKAIEAVSSASAPSDAQYYVAASDGDLSNEVVVPAFIQTLLDDTTQGEAQTTLGLGTGDSPNFDGLFLSEKAAADADVAGLGQFWVQTATPNLAMFTDDAGTDFSLANFETLASTANGDGASLIGIEDAGGLITATTVEAALAENRTAIDAIEADYLTSSDIGSTVQAYDADLDTWAGLTPSANFQTLVTQTFAQMRGSLDLEAGTDFYSIAGADAAFQPLDSDLTAIAGLSSADSNFIVGSAGGWVVESGATVRTSLGLGSLATLSSINNGNWSGTDLSAANGGTGRSSHTAYAVICGGTTTTGAQQSIASVGTSGQVLTSNGAGALPTFEDAAGGGGAFENALLHVRHTETSGTDGGTFTSGSWQTRPLNATPTNEISGASLATNQVTLPAGTYWMEAEAPAFDVDSHQCRWFNATDTAEVLVGVSMVARSTENHSNLATVRGRFTIASSKAFELQHRCSTTKATTGFGTATSWGVEVYADVRIWKVD